MMLCTTLYEGHLRWPSTRGAVVDDVLHNRTVAHVQGYEGGP